MNFLDVLTTSLQQDQNAFKKVVDLKKIMRLNIKNFQILRTVISLLAPLVWLILNPVKL